MASRSAVLLALLASAGWGQALGQHFEAHFDSPAGVISENPCLQLQVSRPTSLEIDTVTRRSGLGALRSVILVGDDPVEGKPRAELSAVACSATRYGAGERHFYGFSIYVPSTFVADFTDNVDIVFQWHNIPDYSEGEGSRSPNAFLSIRGDRWRLRTNSSSKRVNLAEESLARHLDLGTVAKARWTDFVVEARWSFDDQAGDGVMRVWKRVFNQNTGVAAPYGNPYVLAGANMHNDELKGYLKWGIYKPDWSPEEASGQPGYVPSRVTSRTFWHDNVRVGRTFFEVAPGPAMAEPVVALEAATSRVRLTFQPVPVPGTVYRVLASSDLERWSEIWTGSELGSTPVTVTDPVSVPAGGGRFLRLEIIP